MSMQPNSGDLVVEVAGLAASESDDLRTTLDLDPDMLCNNVDTNVESIDPITVISFAISGAEMAHKLWKWWRSGGEGRVDAKLVRPDGTEIHFNDLSEDDLMSLVDKFLGD